jgi:hypothetical protein
LRQVPNHLAHIEDENLLSEVFSRPYETRSQWLARLAATFRPMHDHQGIILDRPGAQWLRIIDFDRPGRIEVYVPTRIGSRLERKGRGEPIVLPFLVAKGGNVEKTLVGRLEVELQACLDRALGRSKLVLSVFASTPNANSMLVSGPLEKAFVPESWFQPSVLRTKPYISVYPGQRSEPGGSSGPF